MSWRNFDDMDQGDEGYVCGGLPFAPKPKMAPEDDWGRDQFRDDDEETAGDAW